MKKALILMLALILIALPMTCTAESAIRLRYAELAETVRRYRELGVPLDGIVQDWHTWEEDR